MIATNGLVEIMRLFLVLVLCFFTLEGGLYDKILRNRPPIWALEQIQSDFDGIVPSDLSHEALDTAMRNGINCARYRVFQENVEIVDFHESVRHSDRLERVASALKEIAKEVLLPYCEFIVCLYDDYEKDVGVAFCFSKKKEVKKGILIPDTDVLANGKTLQLQVLAGKKFYPWNKKREKAFWRGSTTGGIFTEENFHTFPRFQLVELSKQFPDWVDAKFTGLLQGAENLSQPPLLSRYYSVPEQLRFKYQILADGNSCAWSRAYWQLFSGCLMIKHKSDYIQWFYKGLEPNVHYLPTEADFSDLIEVLQWAKEHDIKAKEISEEALKFARANLQHTDLLYYFYLVLQTYSRLQN